MNLDNTNIYQYIILEGEYKNDAIDITFDKNLTNKRFKLRYSFPFIEKLSMKWLWNMNTEIRIKRKKN